MKLIALFVLLHCAAFAAKSGGITPFEAKDVPPQAARQFMCFCDRNGRVVQADIYGVSVREAIQLLATMSKEEVVIESCPEELASMSYRDLSFVEVVHRMLESSGYEIAKEAGGRYRIRKNSDPKTGKPNQALQPTAPSGRG